MQTSTRILYVTEYWPWPSNSGSRLRAAAAIEALTAIGQVDIIHLDRHWIQQMVDDPSPLGGAVLRIEPEAAAPAGEAEEAYPSDVRDVCQQYGAQLRRAFRPGDYDVVWFSRIQTWAPLRGRLNLPTVIDFDDLNDRLNAQSFADTRNPTFAQDAVRWGAAQRAALQEVDQVVVCSALDRQRLGDPANCSVVPNVYLPPAPNGIAVTAESAGPHILFPAHFVWPPNVDAARQLVREILPLVRKEEPNAEVWLVGLNLGSIDDLAGEGVRLFGSAPDVPSYVRAADVVAVPLRQGSGTCRNSSYSVSKVPM